MARVVDIYHPTRSVAELVDQVGELFIRNRGPIRLVIEGVEFEVGKVEPLSDLPATNEATVDLLGS